MPAGYQQGWQAGWTACLYTILSLTAASLVDDAWASSM